MMSNDDGADNGQFLLNAYLRYGFTYVLVVTTYLEGIQGNRLGIEIGRTWLNLNLIIDNNTVSSSTKCELIKIRRFFCFSTNIG